MNPNTKIFFKPFSFQASNFKTEKDRRLFEEFSAMTLDQGITKNQYCCLTPILDNEGNLMSFIVDTPRAVELFEDV